MKKIIIKTNRNIDRMRRLKEWIVEDSLRGLYTQDHVTSSRGEYYPDKYFIFLLLHTAPNFLKPIKNKLGISEFLHLFSQIYNLISLVMIHDKTI